MSTRCQGWTNPDSLFFGPHIDSLSSYQSPSGSNTVVSINGSNFCSFSSVSFGTFFPTVYFVNSNILQFYVPNTLSSGTFSVQVFNGSIGSNIITYTIDNASGYWLLNSNGSISNTNNNGVTTSWLSRGAPVILVGVAEYTVPDNVNWIIGNNTGSDIEITLPIGTQYAGREIMFKNINSSTILATTPNIQNLDGSDVTFTIVSGLGWATLVYDGSTTWYTMQGS